MLHYPAGYREQDCEAAYDGPACWWCAHYSLTFGTWPHPEMSAGKCRMPNAPTYSVAGCGLCPCFQGDDAARREQREWDGPA